MFTAKPTVMKFGGTSVEDANAFARAADIVADRLSTQPVIVVSAMSGMTDALVLSAQCATQGKAEVGLEPHFEKHLRVARDLSSAERDALLSAIDNAHDDV